MTWNPRIPATTLAMVALLAAGAAAAAEPDFSAEALRAHVTFLADDLLEGRNTGTRGHELAARYVATRFESYGLKPGGEDGGWFQRIAFQRTSYVPGRGSVTISGPGSNGPDSAREWSHGGDVLVGLARREASTDVAAPLVFVGFGIENELLGLDDYRGLDVRGRIVVALRGFPKGMPSEEGAHVAATKRRAAERHGAIGIVTINTLQSAKAVPWEQALRYADEPDFAWVDADGKAFEETPGIRASAALNTPPAESLFAGSGRRLADILREADKPGATPRGFPLKTSMRIRSEGEAARVTSPNVIAILPGSDPQLASQYVVLSAHLDHLGTKQPDPAAPDADLINNGALDNASGVATMLEVARLLAASPQRPRRSVLFIATTAEEEGLLGTDYFARHATVPIASIVGNVGLDMPLLLYPFTDLVAFGANHSTLGPLVAQAVAPMGVQLSPDPMPEQGIFTRSDHYMLVRQGVPAVFLTTGFANGGEKVWGEFLGGAYHQPNDDLNQPIDWQAGARFVEANYRIARAMADADQPPLWIEGDFFGDTFARGAPRAPRAP